jgi:hypothetical protein
MKKKVLSCVAVMGLVFACSTSVFAGGRGVSSSSPGHQFIDAGKQPPSGSSAPGASGYAPGQLMNAGAPVTPGVSGNGASVYAPGFLKGR